MAAGSVRRVRMVATFVAAIGLLATACAGGTGGPPVPGDGGDGGPPAAARAAPSEPKYAATQVLVAWRGAASAPAEVTRTEAEARARAVEAWRRASAGEALEGLARELSDAPSAPRGGSVGTWRTGTLVPGFEEAVAALEVGAVSRPFQTPYGWHVVRRDAVKEIEARHILTTWKGAWRSGATRSKDEARARIEQVLAKLAAGEDFADLARTWSDDPTASSGGSLGTVAPGQLVPAFEDAAFGLDVGDRSAVVETPYGFHVIERTR